MSVEVDADMAAAGAIAIVARLIETLVAKSMLTEREGLAIYEGAYTNMGSDADQERYVAMLQGLMPALVADRLAADADRKA